ncbi:MAG TPA: VOC family protein [Tepidisphaeraceae bacterium]|jgi:hypothetical protein|nr:VOC family protein [Tepidisphaeraceae bacterium]
MSHDFVQPHPLADAPAATVPLANADRRPRMPEPLPVRLVTVEDARLIAAAGQESALDAFYVELLGFEKEDAESRLVYRADNFRLVWRIHELPITRNDMRALGIEVPVLREAEQKLIDAEIFYERRRGLYPGQQSLVLQDPAGNWIELTGRSEFR